MFGTTRNRGNREQPRRRDFNMFHRRDRDRVAGGYRAALSNPNTTRSGRKHAKRELRMMGRERDTHVPFMVKVKRALGIRSTSRSGRRSACRRYVVCRK